MSHNNPNLNGIQLQSVNNNKEGDVEPSFDGEIRYNNGEADIILNVNKNKNNQLLNNNNNNVGGGLPRLPPQPNVQAQFQTNSNQLQYSNSNPNPNPYSFGMQSNMNFNTNTNTNLQQLALAKALNASSMPQNNSNININPNQHQHQHQPVVSKSIDDLMEKMEKNESANKHRSQLTWIILLCVILTFNTISVIYLLFFNSYQITYNCECSTSDNADASTVSNGQTTLIPTQENLINDPSTVVTLDPSNVPTKSPNTKNPSFNPSNSPTNSPTVYDGWSIGDIKVSTLNESHNYWLLCDGSFIDNRDYSLLFDVIGYTFGNSEDFSYLFALPNATDRVIGMFGNIYNIGDMVGDQTNTLTESNLASHFHYVIADDYCEDRFGTDYPYLSDYCADSTITTTSDNYYNMRATTAVPDTAQSETVGNDEPFSIMQPTLFVGRLFIYTGQVCDSC